jgi:hypothetical protein
VVPCSLHGALAWSQGLLDDTDLILFDRPPLPEAFLVASLPDISAWRNALAQMLALWRAGARAAILRTGTPAVVHHVNRWGCRLTFQESNKARYLILGADLDHYFGRIAQKARAASVVTNSR